MVIKPRVPWCDHFGNVKPLADGLEGLKQLRELQAECELDTYGPGGRPVVTKGATNMHAQPLTAAELQGMNSEELAEAVFQSVQGYVTRRLAVIDARLKTLEQQS